MGRKAKNAIRDSLKGLSKITQRSKGRFEDSLRKAKLGNYKGADFVEDLFEQWQDIWEVWANVGAPEVQIAYIYLPADGTNSTAWDSADLEFDEPVNQGYVNALTKTDLSGPVVAGVQKKIAKNEFTIMLKNPVQNVSSDFFVRVTKTPAMGDVGVYRGLLLDGNVLIAEICVYAH